MYGGRGGELLFSYRFHYNLEHTISLTLHFRKSLICFLMKFEKLLKFVRYKIKDYELCGVDGIFKYFFKFQNVSTLKI